MTPRAPRGVPLALRFLAHRRLRTTVAASGIAFATLFMFVQLGFYGAVTNTALAVASRLDGALVIVSPRFVHFAEPGAIERQRLFQALAVPGVARATPMYLGYTDWRSQGVAGTCRMFTIGVPLDEPLPLAAEPPDALTLLRRTNAVLVDRLTQTKCGPLDAGRGVEIRQQPVRIAGTFDLGVGFLGDGAVLLSDDTYAAVFGARDAGPSIGVVTLQPDADPGDVRRRLAAALPSDVRVLTMAELRDVQLQHWIRDTAAGNIFSLGTVAGFVVGFVVLYQILSSDIRTQIAQYATMRAIGVADRRLYGCVLGQASIFAVLAFVPAWMAAAAVFSVIRQSTRLPIAATVGNTTLVFGLTVVMCLSAAALSLRRLALADPADLF